MTTYPDDILLREPIRKPNRHVRKSKRFVHFRNECEDDYLERRVRTRRIKGRITPSQKYICTPRKRNYKPLPPNVVSIARVRPGTVCHRFGRGSRHYAYPAGQQWVVTGQRTNRGGYILATVGVGYPYEVRVDSLELILLD